MMNPQEKVLKMLNALNIEYQIINHPAVKKENGELTGKDFYR